MKRLKIIHIRFIFTSFLLIGSILNKGVAQTIDSNSYISKTYWFLGNSFKELHHSKIDTANYFWRDSFYNEKLMMRENPKYQGGSYRKETYEYSQNGNLQKVAIETTTPIQRTFQDSILYKKIDSKTTKIIKSEYTEVHKTSNDTTYIEHFISGRYGFTEREFWESLKKKHRQIIKPEMGDVLHIFVYNEYGDVVEIERYEKGKYSGKSRTNYEYDANNKIITKDIYDRNMELSSKKITIYKY